MTLSAKEKENTNETFVSLKLDFFQVQLKFAFIRP